MEDYFEIERRKTAKRVEQEASAQNGVLWNAEGCDSQPSGYFFSVQACCPKGGRHISRGHSRTCSKCKEVFVPKNAL